MKIFVRLSLILLVALSSVGFVSAQSVTVTLYYSGAQAQGCCNVCGTDYWCVNNTGGCGTVNPTWALNFNDPVPSGNVVTSASATFYVADCYASSMPTSINSTSIGAAPIGGSCACGTCNPRTASASWGCSGLPSYNYGGSNSLIVAPNGAVCMQRVVVTLNYVPITPAPAVGNTGPVCAGQNVDLFASTISGATYLWTGPNGFTATTQNPTIPSITSAGAGTYTVTATANGCPGPSASTTVTVLPSPAAPSISDNGPLCVGDNLQLSTPTVSGATYNWSGPNNFTSGLQNPTINNVTASNGGTYQLNLTVNGCSGPGSSTQVVISNPPPAPSPTNSGPICAGQTLNLYANTISGATYSWTGPNGFTSTSQNPTIPNVTTAATGQYSVTADIDGCLGNAGVTNVSILTAPSAPTPSNNSPICAGQTLNLYATSVPGATYSWTGPNGYTSSSQNPVRANANATFSGTYTVIVTVNGCPSTPVTTDVFVGDGVTPPTVTANSPICAGETLTLTTQTFPGATYQWTGPNGFSANTQNPTLPNVTSNNTGSYSVVVNFGVCGTSLGSTSVTVNPLPATPTAGNNGPLCEGSTLNLTAATVPGATYSWSGPDNFSSTSQNPSISNSTTAASGTYTVTATINGCSSSSTTNVSVGSIPTAPTAGSNGPLCVGDTLRLTADTISGVTYSWTGPNSYSSSSQNPSIVNVTTNHAGNYTVTATLGNCASSSSTVSVTVNPIPASPTASNNGPLCAGSDLNLTASTVSGASYSWTGPNSYSSSSQNPTIAAATTNDAGTYYVMTTINGCSSNPVPTSVTINSIPASPTVSSNSPICAGQTLNLTASTVSGASYLWTGPNNFASPLQNPSIPNATAAATGTYYVSVTVNGCTSSPGSSGQGVIDVEVSAIPNAPGAAYNNPLCEGDTLRLGAGTISGATYYWSGPNAFTSNQQNPKIPDADPSMNGTYTVYASNNGCDGPSSTVTVTITPAPTAPNASNTSPVCAGQTVQLFASTVSGASYSWSGPNNFSSLQQNPQVTNTTSASSGTYSVVSNVGGCQSDPATTTVTINDIPSPPTASNNGPLCAGDELQLTASTVSGATYNWTGPNGFSSSMQNPTVQNITSAGAGVYSVSVTVDGCTSASGTTTLTVASGVTTPTVSNNGPLCETDDLSLTASTVPGATYSWTGPNGFTSSDQNPTIFFVNTTQAGQYDLVVNIGNCTSSAVSTTVVINPAPFVSFNDPGDYCVSDSDVDLSTFVTPSGGVFGGNGINGTTFSPSTAGVGFHSITYMYTDGGSGCSSSALQGITVSAGQSASFTGLASTYCIGDASAVLTGSPTGGTFAGPGISVDVFDPNSAGTGSHSITYTFVDTIGCSSVATEQVTVNDTTASGFSGLDNDYCLNSPTDALTGIPGGGTFLGAGISGNNFDPGSAGAGTHTITYLYTNNNNCSSNAQQQTTVHGDPTVSITGLQDNYCQNSGEQPATGIPGGGTFGGPGMSGNSFYPSIAGLGTHIISYSYTDGFGCTGTAYDTITVTTEPDVDFTGLSAQTCENGDLIVLSPSPTGGTFSGTGVSGDTFDPASAGTGQHTVTYVFDDGNCSGTASHSTTVNVAPEPTATANGPLSFCMGDSVNIGTGNYDQYQWSNSGTSSNITVLQSGTYNVTVTDANGCTGTSNDVVVEVNPLPTATITPNGSTSFCQGDSVILTAGGGVTYMWSNGFTSQSLTVYQTDALYVTATDTNGCSATSATTQVTVTSGTPVITSDGPLTFCEGDSVNLTASEGTDYLWSTGRITQTITVTESGAYTVMVSGSNGCDGISDTTNVVVNPLPDPNVTDNPDTVLTGQQYASYQWYFNGNPISGANNYYHIYTEPGYYSVVVTDDNGCTSESDSIQVIVTSINDNEVYTITVYPNPNTGEFVVKAEFPSETDYAIEVTDLAGKLMLPSAIMGNSKSLNHRFDIRSLADGVYLLKIKAGSEQVIRRIVKQ